MHAPAESATERLEQQLAWLARLMEAVYRKRAYPMERAHYLLLLRLRTGPRSVGELADELALEHSTVTRQIAAMEERGLVGKRTSPVDRRSVLIEPTPLGAEQCEAMRRFRLERLEAMLSSWPPGRSQALAGMIEELNALLAATLTGMEGEHPLPSRERVERSEG